MEVWRVNPRAGASDPAPSSADLHTSVILTMERLEKLRELELKLYTELQRAESRSVAAIARQYRETIKEIEEIEGSDSGEDEIEKLLNGRDGMPGAVRKDHTKI